MTVSSMRTGAIGSRASARQAYGGTITTSGAYTIHTFTASGTFTAMKPLSCEYLVVAGGGGGIGTAPSVLGLGGSGIVIVRYLT